MFNNLLEAWCTCKQSAAQAKGATAYIPKTDPDCKADWWRALAVTHLAGLLCKTSNDGMAVWPPRCAIIVVLHDHCLLPSIPPSEQDHHLTGLQDAKETEISLQDMIKACQSSEIKSLCSTLLHRKSPKASKLPA